MERVEEEEVEAGWSVGEVDEEEKLKIFCHMDIRSERSVASDRTQGAAGRTQSAGKSESVQ